MSNLLSCRAARLIMVVFCGIALALGNTTAWAADAPAADKPEEQKDADQQKTDDAFQKLLDDTAQDAKVKRDRNRALARHHTEVGIGEFKANNFKRAKEEFEKALQYDKTNKEARTYLRKTDSLLGLKRGEWSNVVEDMVSTTRVARQIAKVEMENRFEEAKAAFDQHNYAKAINGFERVDEIIKWIEPYANVEKWKANTKDYLARAKRGKIEQAQREAQERRQEAMAIAREREKARQSFVTNRIETLIAQGRQLFAAGRFDEAQSKFKAVTNIDPENEKAAQLAENARIAGVEAWAKRNAKARNDHSEICWELVEQFAVPQISTKVYQVLWYDVDKWFERVVDREPVLIGQRSEEDEPWKQEIREKLQQPVTFDFIDTPLEDIILFLRQLTDVNFVLDSQAVEGLEFQEVTFKATDMKLEAALEWMLKMVNLKYTLKNNAVFISDNIQGEAIRQLYDVTDLTLEIRDFKGDLRHLRTRTGTSVSGGGGGSDVDDEIFTMPEEEGDEEGSFTGRSLVDFIRQTIAPGTWSEDLLE